MALANQTRAEDIDLAIHAELEGIRRALLRLPVGGATSPEKGQVGEGQAESLQRDGKRKSNEVFMGYATAGTEEEGTKLTSTEVPAPAVTAVTQEASHQDSKINQLKTEVSPHVSRTEIAGIAFSEKLIHSDGRGKVSVRKHNPELGRFASPSFIALQLLECLLNETLDVRKSKQLCIGLWKSDRVRI